MDTHKEFFGLASDIEGTSIVLEDVLNLLTVYDEQMWEWWQLTKRFLPQLPALSESNFNMYRSLLTAARLYLCRIAAQTEQTQQKAYSLAEETAK